MPSPLASARSRPAGLDAHTLAVAALLAGAAAIGASAVLVKLTDVGPVSSAFWRVFLALPVLLLWVRLERRPGPSGDVCRHDDPPALTPGGLGMAAVAGFLFAGDLAVWHWSIRLTSVANATLLANCAPIFVILVPWLVFGRRPGAHVVLGLVAALAGMALLLRGDFHHAGTAVLGDGLAVVTAMFYAAYQVTVTRARRSISTARIMAVSVAVSAAILLPIALLCGERLLPQSAAGWLPLLGLALFVQAGGQSLIAYAMAHLPATFSSVGLLLQPVIAAALAWAVLGEALTALALGGAVLVLVGIRIAHAAARPLEKADDPLSPVS